MANRQFYPEPEQGSIISYFSQFGEKQSDGVLEIHISGHEANGDLWDGIWKVGSDHPNYSLWLQAIGEKENFQAFLDAERKQERRRRQRKATACG